MPRPVPLAATVTAAARCVLALTEADLNDRGSRVLCRDTDGFVVTTLPDGQDLHAVLGAWDRLAMDGGSFWKITAGTPDAPQLAISFGPKRNALGRVDANGGRFTVVSATEHVLGAYVPPPTMPGRNGEDRHDWCTDVAGAHAEAIATRSRVERFTWEDGSGLGLPALRRIQPSTPAALAALPAVLGARPFARIVEARTAPMGSHTRPVALDPGGDLTDWSGLAWYDARTGEPLRLTTNLGDIDASDDRCVAHAALLRDKALDWARPHPWALPELIVVDPLLVRHVGRAGHLFLAGFPDVVYEEADEAAILVEAATRLGATWLANRAGISERTAQRLRAGTTPRLSTIAAARAALRRNGLALGYVLDLARSASDRCARCGAVPRRPRSAYCSRACADAGRFACAAEGCAEPVRQDGARCDEHRFAWDRERCRLAARRRRKVAQLARSGGDHGRHGDQRVGELRCLPHGTLGPIEGPQMGAP